jgi:hypothetical protein
MMAAARPGSDRDARCAMTGVAILLALIAWMCQRAALREVAAMAE